MVTCALFIVEVSNHMNYRREIDGLRALAVIPVILFHAGIQSFSGGFVGVDIFFVISGYLITTIIINELAVGTFTLANFYERRARRVLPALFLVMLCCLPFAWFWLLPADLKSFSLSLIAVPLFISNILFYLTSGYFETAAELIPLLHTWSLAVEEQYYVLFPLFLLLIWRIGKLWITLLFLIMAALSLSLAQWGSVTHPLFTFFLLPTRGWEILIGALAAFYLSSPNKKPLHPLLKEVAAAIGLLAITASIFVFDKETPFPSLYALIPTLGTALIILFATEQTLTGKLLGNKLFVGIGLISYSAYLWHQPLFAFARYKSLHEPSHLLLLTLAAVAIVFAYLSWKYVETPFRNKQRIPRKTIFVFAVTASLFFITLGAIGTLNGGFVDRLTAKQQEIAAYKNYDYSAIYRRSTCFLDNGESSYLDFAKECGNSNPENTMVIWGDSYAAAFSRGLRDLGVDVVQYTASTCPPVMDTVAPDRPHCLNINKFVGSEIERIKPKQIILHSNWQLYKHGLIINNIEKTLAFIKKASPASEIIVVGNVPQWMPTLPMYALKSGISLDQEYYLKLPSYEKLESGDKELKEMAIRNGVKFVSALDKLCRKDQCLVVTQYKNSFHLTAMDNGHLTEAGSVALAKMLFQEKP